jgi:hypothetical protein
MDVKGKLYMLNLENDNSLFNHYFLFDILPLNLQKCLQMVSPRGGHWFLKYPHFIQKVPQIPSFIWMREEFPSPRVSL